jgi:hypothetical protein
MLFSVSYNDVLLTGANVALRCLIARNSRELSISSQSNSPESAQKMKAKAQACAVKISSQLSSPGHVKNNAGGACDE